MPRTVIVSLLIVEYQWILRYSRLAGRGSRRGASHGAAIIADAAAAVVNGDDFCVWMDPCNSARRCAAFPLASGSARLLCSIMSMMCLFCCGYLLRSNFQIGSFSLDNDGLKGLCLKRAFQAWSNCWNWPFSWSAWR